MSNAYDYMTCRQCKGLVELIVGSISIKRGYIVFDLDNTQLQINEGVTVVKDPPPLSGQNLGYKFASISGLFSKAELSGTAG